jgi:hypothetical protein
MSRLTHQAVRTGVSTVAVAAGLMVLASTTQTPDGFIQTGFRGPLAVFGNAAPEDASDLLAIGDGSGDVGELAAILNAPPSEAGTEPPAGVVFEAGTTAISAPAAIGAPVTQAPIAKQSLTLPKNPVVDAQGRVDCTGSVSCMTDPVTRVTTVTYADGVVALVQRVNDMTVVAYKTVTQVLPNQVQALLPPPFQIPLPAVAPRPAAAAPPVQSPAVQAPAIEDPEPQSGTSAINPGPDVAPPAEISASTVRPRIVVTKPPKDFGPGPSRPSNPTGGLTIPAVKPTSPLDVVRDAIGSVVDAVTGRQNPSKTIKDPSKTVKDPSTTIKTPTSPASDGPADPAPADGE